MARQLWQSLAIEKYYPKNIKRIEQNRFNAIMKHKKLIKEKWGGLFLKLPKEGIVYGTKHTWDRTKTTYEDETVVLKFDGAGLSVHYVRKSNLYDALDFVRCLDINKLPLYINSGIAQIREYISERLKGTPGYDQYPKRQDLIDLYFRVETESHRLTKAIGYYELIIKNHFDEMLRRIDKKYPPEIPLITLSINNRLYVYQNGVLIIKPETENYVFFESDLSKNDRVNIPYGGKYSFSITPRPINLTGDT